jgi:hypothetical protein
MHYLHAIAATILEPAVARMVHFIMHLDIPSDHPIRKFCMRCQLVNYIS